MSFMRNPSGVYGERAGVASQEETLLSWFCVYIYIHIHIYIYILNLYIIYFYNICIYIYIPDINVNMSVPIFKPKVRSAVCKGQGGARGEDARRDAAPRGAAPRGAGGRQGPNGGCL